MNSRARWIRHSISVLSYSYRITPYAHICARRERQCKDGRIQVKSIGSGSGSDLAKNFGPDPDPDPVLVKMSGRLASWADWLLAWCMLNFLRPFYQVFSNAWAAQNYIFQKFLRPFQDEKCQNFGSGDPSDPRFCRIRIRIWRKNSVRIRIHQIRPIAQTLKPFL